MTDQVVIIFVWEKRNWSKKVGYCLSEKRADEVRRELQGEMDKRNVLWFEEIKVTLLRVDEQFLRRIGVEGAVDLHQERVTHV